MIAENLSTLEKDSLENERYLDGHSRKPIKRKEETRMTTNLLDEILSPKNMNLAYKRVVANKGSCGVDGIKVEDLLEHLKDHKVEIIGKIRNRTYKPKPVRRVQIPKPNGKKRNLGIPTTTDRVIQQSIYQVLSPIYEKQFSEYSYGFRPNRGCHDALKQVKVFVDEGYPYVVDMDLSKFFDTVNQSRLIQILSNTIEDGDVISLIHKFMKSGIMMDGMFYESTEGVPQGGPLSPLLANIYLNEADHKFEEWGYKFVRYADDIMIFARNQKAAERYGERVIKYLEKELNLKVNREKTSIKYITQVKYLGYGFYQKDGELKFIPHKDSVKRLKTKLKAITNRSNGKSPEWVKLKLRQVSQGWIQYFKMADMKALLIKMDAWLRRRIRMRVWKTWKKVKTRYVCLQKLGISKHQAWQWANTRRGCWKIAGSPILSRALSNKRIAKQGYICLSDYYELVRI